MSTSMLGNNVAKGVISSIVVFCVVGAGVSYGTVETGWPMGTRNVCDNPTDGFIDFEGGTDRAAIASTLPGVKFTTTAGLDWLYGDASTGNYNAPYPYGAYALNGNVFAWLGESGDTGRIDLSGGDASYLSLLTSTYSGLVLDAYDANGNYLATSGWANYNLWTGELTRLTVTAPNIAYVLVHDSGNYWLIDDICTNASGVPPVFDHVADLAESVIGAEYTWGAKGYDFSSDGQEFVIPDKILSSGYVYYDPNTPGMVSGTGLDCSGLNVWSYNRTFSLGEKITWNTCLKEKKCPIYYEGADGQYRYNTSSVSKTDLRPGDLLFFSTKVAGVMDHVAMYTGPITYSGKSYNAIHASGFAKQVIPAEWDVTTGTLKTTKADGSIQNLTVTAYRRVAEFKLWMEIKTYSPVSIVVTNPYGDVVDLTNAGGDEDGLTNEVPGLYYMVRDDDGDGEENDIVAVGEPMEGDYVVKVVPKPDALPDDVYSLAVKLYGINGEETTIVLAENVSVKEIPVEPYILSFVAPVADAGGDYWGEPGQTIIFDGGGSYDADGTIVAFEWDWDNDGQYDEQTSSNIVEHMWAEEYVGIVGLRVTDNEGLQGMDTASVEVTYNRPPVAQCQDVTMPADLGVCTVASALVDAGSYDPDGDPITLDQQPTGPYPLGATSVTLTVTDDSSASDSCSALVTVVDVEPPTIEVTVSPDVLWPVNHKLYRIDSTVTTADVCDPKPTVTLESVTSNEATDGLGDGDTEADIVIDEDGTIWLRAERSGTGSDRIYTITYTATDASGNAANASATVTVPHNQ